MRINRSAHTRDFTRLPNRTLRDRSLSFTARGLLNHLLSLPDGSPATIRSLAEQNPDGRQAIANAFAELRRHGYVRQVRHKDPETGRIATVTAVYDVPEVDRPDPVPPGPGGPGGKAAGDNPSGKNPGKKPSLPAPEPPPGGGQAVAGMLLRLAEVEPRLRIGVAEAAALAPLAAEWPAAQPSATSARPCCPACPHGSTALRRCCAGGSS